jgi:hypothetical protein
MATYALLDCSVDGQYGGRAPGARSLSPVEQKILIGLLHRIGDGDDNFA